MSLGQFFTQHINTLQQRYENTLELLESESIHVEGVLLHSGRTRTYFADDIAVPFRAHGHFRHWVPLNLPDQSVLFRPGQKPILFRVQSQSFWLDTSVTCESWWADAFEIIEATQPDDLLQLLPPARRIAFMGEDTKYASRIGLSSLLYNENHLRNRLDYHRSLKTPYEIEQIREANRVALQAHHAARDAFFEGKSEFDIHRAYLEACHATEEELPFPSIVALDEKSSILHYEPKRRTGSSDAQVMLCDAGFTVRGYAADLTRTHARDSAHPVFRELIERVNRIKQHMITSAEAGKSFKILNEETHDLIREALLETGVVRGDNDEVKEKKISNLFFPHGIGHLLGLQVHDVSGLFKDESGILEPPPEEHKSLRLTRILEEGMVCTIEPGIYFIPMLLNAERDTEIGRHLNLTLIDELISCGGIRMEDNVVIRDAGPETLTEEGTP
jgi:Xaa-Pro dipeptidase